MTSDFQPLSPQSRTNSGPGCWLWVPVGCFAFLLASALMAGLGLKMAYQSKGSLVIAKTFAGVMRQGQEMTASVEQMKVINRAMHVYRAGNGVYPVNLTSLVPAYLPDMSTLHSPLDLNLNPSHLSFQYMRPAANALGSTPCLSVTGTYLLTVGAMTQKISTTCRMSLDGSLQRTQTQSTVTTSTAGTPP